MEVFPVVLKIVLNSDIFQIEMKKSSIMKTLLPC